MNIIKQRSTWSTPAIHDETANCLESLMKSPTKKTQSLKIPTFMYNLNAPLVVAHKRVTNQTLFFCSGNVCHLMWGQLGGAVWGGLCPPPISFTSVLVEEDPFQLFPGD